MVHAAVVMDDENSIIIVGERQAMDLGEILKILVNIEAEYWNRIWIDFENRYFGQSGTDGVSRNIFIGIYSYVFRTFEGGVSHKKPAVLGKFGIPVFQIITGGKEFPLKHPGAGICATSHMGGFVTIGGAAPFHGKVDR